MDNSFELPLLPEAELPQGRYGYRMAHVDYFTADQMRAYARAYAIAAVKAEREACAKLAEETVCDVHIPTGVRIYGSRVAKEIRARGKP